MEQMTGTSILDTPEAQQLLEDATVEDRDLVGCRQHLTSYLQRYLPLFYRKEQRENATLVIRGHLSGLERKTSEPMARAAGVQRKPVQSFVGSSPWDDEAVMSELRAHVDERIGEEEGVLIVDGSTFVKKGKDSCGVARQWCGRLGKVENCQTGVFLAYATARGGVLVDRRLYLPKEWAADEKRRDKCHVPAEVAYAEKWRMGLRMIFEHGRQLRHGWIVGDDEFGKVIEFRGQLRQAKECYVLDVPGRTQVRDLEVRRPPRRNRKSRRREVPFVRAEDWAAKQPARRWQRLQVRDGEQGPLQVEAIERRVLSRDEKHRIGPQERLMVIRNLQDNHVDYCLCHAAPQVPLAKLVQVHARRHRVEESLEQGKQEVGLSQYECRSWVGWHHHMTLCLVALFFLVLEQGRLGEKNPGRDGIADAADLHGSAA